LLLHFRSFLGAIFSLSDTSCIIPMDPVGVCLLQAGGHLT
jgi:hypothetical protein